MTKKNLLVAMALPLAFAACSSEDVLTESKELQGQYNVEKVNALFGMDEAESRLATGWHSSLEAGKDMLGLAWLGDGENVTINGKAFQNHPLYTQAGGNLKPETSIYVGEYFTYYPYDVTTVSVNNVNFSVANQPLTTVYNDIAANSIWISPKWTTVAKANDEGVDGEAGISKPTAIYPRLFTNRVRLALEFENTDIEQGNTFINSVQVGYLENGTKSVVAFQYAPENEVTSESPAQDFWANMGINEAGTLSAAPVNPGYPYPAADTYVGLTNPQYGFIKLQSEPYEVLADAEGVGFFYNALPMIGTPTINTQVFLALNTTYGNIYSQEPISLVAYTHTGNAEKPYDEYPDGVPGYTSVKNSFVSKFNKLVKIEIKKTNAVFPDFCKFSVIKINCIFCSKRN